KEKKLLLQDLNIKNINLKEMNIDASDKEQKNDQMAINAHKILEYLLNHINEPTDLLKIAQDMSLSVPSLIRKTKQLTGYSIQKLHEILKIEKAKLLLENKILNISEIADRLGYQNQFYFSQVFKKHTGMSPKKWVELYRK
ncbi:MAG: helix-turn-helix transcriptional regulator, partial [Spirochaetes bacterium]|nr:helix-turn-helix transcriptional regulator [Spirochaetota bacterium]